LFKITRDLFKITNFLFRIFKHSHFKFGHLPSKLIIIFMKILQALEVTTDELKALIQEAVREEFKLSDHQYKSKIRYLTRQQAADKLHISLPTLSKWTQDGRLRSLRIGGRILYLESELINNVNNQL
jgi:excisionase family DNA binding protein